VSYHYWPDPGEESHVDKDAGYCPSSCWGGQGGHRALGSGIFYCGGGARVLA
jgi:hypothetical protein